jgi:DNA-binding transcriptional regulator YiaG
MHFSQGDDMSKEEFAAIRAAVGMSYSALAGYLDVKELRSVQRYESGERQIPGSVAKLMRFLQMAGSEERLMQILERGSRTGKGKP